MSEAVIGFSGVIIGALLAPLIEWIRERSRNTKEARYLAIRVICVLDKFIDMCVAVAGDQGFPDEHGCYEYQARQPELAPFSEDLDWRVIDHELAYDILSLPNKIENSKNYINDALYFWIAAPYDELGPELQYEYSKLGLFALDITNRLRKAYKIPGELENTRHSDWSPQKFLTETKEKIEEARKKHEEVQSELLKTMDLGAVPKPN